MRRRTSLKRARSPSKSDGRDEMVREMRVLEGRGCGREKIEGVQGTGRVQGEEERAGYPETSWRGHGERQRRTRPLQ